MKKPSQPVEDPAPGPSSAGVPMDGAEASPYKSAAEELALLGDILREVAAQFVRRLEIDIVELRERVLAAGEEHTRQDGKLRPVRRTGGKALGDGRLYDLRDIITLLRTLDTKPAAGRRKDLKKIESLVEELRDIVARWG